MAAGVAVTFCVWCCMKVGSESERAMERAEAQRKRKLEETEPDLDELDRILNGQDSLLYEDEDEFDLDEELDPEVSGLDE